jgi:lysophospholipase L1-like esterase
MACGATGSAIAEQDTGETSEGMTEPWDLVWFTDSFGFHVARLWAEQIEETLGVEVRVHDHALGRLAATEVLESLSEDGLSRLGDTRAEVAEAEVIVIFANPVGSGVTTDYEPICMTTDPTPRDPPRRVSPEDFAPYQQTLESVYARVFDLVGDRPVIVRALDSFNPVVADWAAAGLTEGCMIGYDALTDAMHGAAAAFDIPVVSLRDAYNGPEMAEDPREKGYIAGDGIHPSPAGQEAIMTALHAAGYDPIHP